jgi:hypothetical protein
MTLSFAQADEHSEADKANPAIRNFPRIFVLQFTTCHAFGDCRKLRTTAGWKPAFISLFYIIIVIYSGSDDAVIIAVIRSGFERLLRVLRQREEVRVATELQSSSYFAMRQQRLPNGRCDNWKSGTPILHVFPHSLLSKEIKMIGQHNSDAIGEGKFRNAPKNSIHQPRLIRVGSRHLRCSAVHGPEDHELTR